MLAKSKSKLVILNAEYFSINIWNLLIQQSISFHMEDDEDDVAFNLVSICKINESLIIKIS